MKTGRPSKFTRETKAIRVPELFARGLLNYAHLLDEPDAGRYYITGSDTDGYALRCRMAGRWENYTGDDPEVCRGVSFAWMSKVALAMNLIDCGSEKDEQA